LRNSLDTDAGQWNATDTAEVRARTAYGDIVIRKAKQRPHPGRLARPATDILG
jgi:hypothetical protein